MQSQSKYEHKIKTKSSPSWKISWKICVLDVSRRLLFSSIVVLIVLSVLVSSINIRKIRSTLDNLYLEKQKIEKGDKPKKKAAVKGKGKLRMEADVSLLRIFKYVRH